MALATVSLNLQCELYVLKLVWAKQCRSTMARYSFQEQTEMVFVYGQAGGNGREAARIYRGHLPWQVAPSISHNIWSHLSPFVWTWVPWRPLRTSVVTWMGFRPWTVCQDSLFDVVLQCHLLWELCISGHKVIWTFMLHFQWGFIPWSLSVDLKLTLYKCR